eukprot:TRINITY_DN3257_c0_g1_i1.p1 TRINITY_DN3257_c0_g1~~TRINITY_DN3257_c0_g1_i1.p1  ORF type:complete len:562 (+),score=152.04 TRINITY_DN3257_c0_g1_i1:144-1829(+)
MSQKEPSLDRVGSLTSVLNAYGMNSEQLMLRSASRRNGRATLFPTMRPSTSALLQQETEVVAETKVPASPVRSASTPSAPSLSVPPSPQNGVAAASPRRIPRQRSLSASVVKDKQSIETAERFVQTDETHMDLVDLRERLRNRMQFQDDIEARFAAQAADVQAKKDEVHQAEKARLLAELDEAHEAQKKAEADFKVREARWQESAQNALKVELQKAEDQKNLVVNRLKTAIKQKLQDLNGTHKAELAKQQESWAAKLKSAVASKEQEIAAKIESAVASNEQDIAAKVESAVASKEQEIAAKIEQAVEQAVASKEQDFSARLEELARAKDAEAKELLAAREEEMREWTESYEAEQQERENAMKDAYAQRESTLFAKFEMMSQRNLKQALMVKDDSIASLESKMKQDLNAMQSKYDRLRQAFMEERRLRHHFEDQLRTFIPDLPATAEAGEGSDWLDAPMDPAPSSSSQPALTSGASPRPAPRASSRQASRANSPQPAIFVERPEPAHMMPDPAGQRQQAGGVDSPGLTAASSAQLESDFGAERHEDLAMDPVGERPAISAPD